MNSKLGGAIDTLATRDSLGPLASMGNPRRKGGGYEKSPLAGSMLGAKQLNHGNLAKNDVVDPLGEQPDAQETLIVALPQASIIAITTAELAAVDAPAPPSPGGGDGGTGGTGGDGGGAGDGGGGGGGDAPGDAGGGVSGAF